MAPDKDQAENKTESDHLPYQWWTHLDVGENEPDCRRKLRELRSERKVLLRRLGGKVKSDEEVVTTTLDLYLMRHCAPVFQASNGGRLRVKLLAAIGKCKTLRVFDTKGFHNLYLQPEEWEALLKRMKRNCQLLECIVWEPQGLPARMCPIIGELVKHAGNLTTLQFGNFGSLWAVECQQELAGIASGLQGHKHAKLVNFTASCELVSTNIVKIISSAPRLSYLSLGGPCSMDENTKVVLCAALKKCSDLKGVTLIRTSEGILEVLGNVYAQRFSDPQQVSVLENLELIRPPSLIGLACLASSNIRNLEIKFYTEELLNSPEEWQRVGRSLVRHPTLRVFKIQVTLGHDVADTLFPFISFFPFEVRHFIDTSPAALTSIKKKYLNLEKGLAELWEASENSPLLDISAHIRVMEDTQLMFLKNTLKDNFLKVITFHRREIDPRSFKTFAEKVGASTSVRCLRLPLVHVEDGWAPIFHHLRENTSITTLNLSDSRGLNDENFRDLMDLLQVNFILREVELERTTWVNNGKRALVQAALERNAKLAGYFSVLGAAQLSFDGAKAGRIFLCGLPFAGKTQLKVTMMECLGKTSTSESLKEILLRWIPEPVARRVPGLRRTEGIEVELFYDKEAMTISIWDFAGQQIFRPLQNILFPKISQACVFIFVFNPFNIIDGKITELKKDLHVAFAVELRSWLRFIVSNTQITGRIRAQVIVVITHKDIVEKCKSSFGQLSISEFQNIVEHLQGEFKDVVELCPQSSGQEGELVYHINATLKQDLEPLTNVVISSMKDVLSRKSPKVPRVCSELVSFLLSRPPEVQTKPLWPCKNLYDFCSTNSGLLSHIDVTQEQRGKVLHAIASYMHDAGAVCMTPRALTDNVNNSDADSKMLAVVDLNWLTQNLLGQLITLRHPRETMKGASARRFDQVKVDADGFLNTQQLESMLHCVLSEQKDKEVDISMVKELLLELDLCYSLESGEGKTRYFFMPMLFGEESTGTTSKQIKHIWEGNSPQGLSFFGYRIQCRDPDRTALSPAFYPRYQIHLRKRMGATLGVKDENFTFDLSHVMIRVDGYCIFVETDVSSGNHIDILVQFCEPNSQDRVIDYTRNHIIQDIFKFCASEKGCPGVQLVDAVIRTKCVEKLTPKQLRTASQVVSVEDLKNKFKKDLKNWVESKVGLKMPARSVRKLNELYQRGCEDNLQMRNFLGALEFSCYHSWPMIGTADASEFSLVAENERAVDLLSSKELRDIVQSIWEDHKVKLWPQQVPEGKVGPCHEVPRTSMLGEQEVNRICDELYEVYVPATGDINVELVFIHGLQKDVTQRDIYFSAWTVGNDESNCWLMSWLPNRIPNCRILSVSYDASTVKTSTEGRMDMYLTAENLATSLVEFGKIGQKCPVILVGHSLGGLVAITVCNKVHSLASLDRILYRNFCNNIKGLFFYSTPFSGVKFSDLVAPREVTFWGSEGGEAGDLMESLELFDKRTSRRNYDFAQLKGKYGWKTQGVVESCTTVFEGLASSSTVEFVDEGSARTPFMDDVKVIPDTDHFSVCRPEEEISNNFQFLVNFVQHILNQG